MNRSTMFAILTAGLTMAWPGDGGAESLFDVDGPTTVDGATDGVAGDAIDTPPDADVSLMPPEDEGCQCRVAAAPGAEATPTAFLALMALLARRRRSS